MVAAIRRNDKVRSRRSRYLSTAEVTAGINLHAALSGLCWYEKKTDMVVITSDSSSTKILTFCCANYVIFTPETTVSIRLTIKLNCTIVSILSDIVYMYTAALM